MPQQPDDFDVAVGLGFEPAAGAHTVEIAIDVELQEILGGISRPAGHFACDPDEPCRGQIQPVDKGINETNGVFGTDILVQRFWKEQRLGSIVAGDVRHGGF